MPTFEQNRGIVVGRDAISEPCEAVSVEDGVEIAATLVSVIPPNAVGIAANQIGLRGRVCYVNAGQPIILINPTIVRSSGRIHYLEGCLSFPGEAVRTERFSNIVVKADNHDKLLEFGTQNLLECVCVQHEIDHLDGITMHERRVT